MAAAPRSSPEVHAVVGVAPNLKSLAFRRSTRSREACHARPTDDGGRRSRRRGAQRKFGRFREAGQSLVDSALSGIVDRIRKRLVRGADHGTNSARGNSLSGAATFYESSVQSVPLSSCGPLDAHARAACVDGEAATGRTWHDQGGAPATRPPRLRCVVLREIEQLPMEE